MKNSEYFDIVGELPDEEAARAALARGEVQFILNIPAGFTRRVLRGERPALLVEADATDPMATGMALASVDRLARSVAAKDLTGPLAFLAGGKSLAVASARPSPEDLGLLGALVESGAVRPVIDRRSAPARSRFRGSGIAQFPVAVLPLPAASSRPRRRVRQRPPPQQGRSPAGKCDTRHGRKTWARPRR